MNPHRYSRCRICRSRPSPPSRVRSEWASGYRLRNVVQQFLHYEQLHEVHVLQLHRAAVLRSYIFLGVGLFGFLLGGTQADVVGRYDGPLAHRGGVLDQVAETVELGVLLGRLRGDVLEQEQLGLPEFVALGLNGLLVLFLLAPGHLRVLLLDLVDFGDIDEGDVLLPAYFLQLQAFVYRAAAHHVQLLLYRREFQRWLPPTQLLHLIFISKLRFAIARGGLFTVAREIIRYSQGDYSL